ncbi:MAG TPA: hypothetical protein VJ761_08430 [Ktedonobacteraceae bacterium]|nr:hypothetical protein [Ktedonobacteraceae bacterium]
MDDTEHEQFHDDVEISDIPAEEISNARPGWIRRGSEASLLRLRQLPPRQRNLYLAVTSGIIGLIVIIVIGSSPAARGTLQAGIFGQAPTPTPTLAPGLDLFYIEGIPSWSQVSLDGHRLTHLPSIGESPIQIPRGHHAIVWHAAPFSNQSCTMSVPPVFASDTCRINQAVRLHAGLSAWIISFDVSLTSLPDDQRTALVQKVQAALDKLQSSAIIQPGEQYAADVLTGGQLQASVTTVTATQPLRATLNFQLDAAPNSQQTCAAGVLVQDCQACRLFCPPPNPVPQTSSEAQQWNVLALIYSTWTYTTLDGHVIARDQSNSEDHPLELGITWDGTNWHVNILFNQQTTSQGDLACLPAEEEIGSTGEFSLTGGEVAQSAPVNWHFRADSNLAAGCLATGTPLNDTATPTTLPIAYLLDRFGVILAANIAAHQYWALNPVADKEEQKLAQQLAVLPPLE